MSMTCFPYGFPTGYALLPSSSTNPTASIPRSPWTPTDTSHANLHETRNRRLQIQREGGGGTALTETRWTP